MKQVKIFLGVFLLSTVGIGNVKADSNKEHSSMWHSFKEKLPKSKKKKKVVTKKGGGNYTRSMLNPNLFDDSQPHGLNVEQVSLALCMDRKVHGKGEGFPSDVSNYTNNRDQLGEDADTPSSDLFIQARQNAMNGFKKRLLGVLTEGQIKQLPEAADFLTTAKYDSAKRECYIP